MTSKRSSVDVFRISFVQTLQRFWYHGAALLLLLTPMFGDLHDLFRHRFYYEYEFYENNILDSYIFAFNRYAGFVGMGYICLALGLSAMFLALHCWRFMHVKKTVNVYFSLGQSRSNLFWSRCLACAVLLIAPVVLIFAVLLVCNLILFGSSWQLWAATGIYILSFIAIALFSFAVTTLSMCATGASIESFLCAGCLIAMPVTVYFGLQYLSIFFLKGAAFDVYISDLLTGAHISVGRFGGSAMFLNFFYPLDDPFSDGFTAYKEDGWQSPGVGYALTWLAAAVIVALLGAFVFKKRKAENAGFLGKNPALVSVACLSLSFLLVYPAYFLVDDEVADRLIIFLGVPILLLVYVLVMSALLRNRKKLLRALPAGLAVCAVFALTCLGFLFDVSGFEKRMPDEEDIASVAVSVDGLQQALVDEYVTFSEHYSSWEEIELTQNQFIADHLNHWYVYNTSVITGLTQEEDIALVSDIHSKMIQAEEKDLSVFSYPVALQYTLKNGKTLTRYYPKCTPEVMQLLQKFRVQTDVTFIAEENLRERYVEIVSLLAPAASQITVLPSDMQDEDLIGSQLIEALIGDLREGTLRMDGFDGKVPVGYISFASNLRTQEDEYSYEPYYGSYTEDVVYAEVGPETEIEQLRTYTLDEVCETFDYYDAYGIYPVYDDMKNTLTLLEQYDLLQYFQIQTFPVRAKVLRTPFAEESAQTVASYGREFMMKSSVFSASYADNSASGESLVDLMPGGEQTTDPEAIAQLVSGACLRYDVTLDGYFVAFEYAGGTSTVMYVPMHFVPQELQ